MKNVIAALLTTICLLAALTACGSQTPKETAATSAAEGQRVIRIGFQKYGTMNVLKAQGWLEKRLADAGVKVEWTEFPGGPQLLEALNVGSIDIGHTGEAPPIFAQAAGAPLVYLAHEPPSPQGEGILVPNGSPVKTVADLKGKKVALNKGSNVHYLLVKQLEAAGLQYKDVKTAFLPPADARAAFEQGSVDAWVVWDPFLAAAQTATNATLLADGRDVVSNHEFYLASRTFAESHPDIIDALLDELNKVDEWAKNNQDELAELLSAQLGIDVPSLKLASGRREYGVRPITDEVIAEQQRIADTFAKLGLIPQPIHVKDAVWKK
ncbi:sulfonate ABC transporter substrate-binding protein [Brevibacillus thermoruber]|uniref:Putative aliphatic sulfonates-binding protein n=1 Tax=Brevibacillus thermoruber TaxID=33942 RepID=A0A9X3TNX1_9BACL|nr:sulfonate ABC transporter substrate-binding protein [Brevibacillus thermoruber]MDA5107976.1 sulfonate ABC transporter substrate-binding protein [Brevibacillus thermoruber]